MIQLFPSTIEVNRLFGTVSSIGDSDKAGIGRKGAMESVSDLGRGVSRLFSLGREGRTNVKGVVDVLDDLVGV
jgi:hypothetical protein